MAQRNWIKYTLVTLILCMALPIAQLFNGWPVQAYDLTGVYHLDGKRAESIQLKPDNVFYWSSSLASGEKVKAKGNWRSRDLGWNGFWGRAVRLETVTFLNQRGEPVEFSGGACSGSLSDLESPTPSCEFTINSAWGKVVTLGMSDIHWVKQGAR